MPDPTEGADTLRHGADTRSAYVSEKLREDPGEGGTVVGLAAP